MTFSASQLLALLPLLLTTGAMAALMQRGRTGQGQHLDIAHVISSTDIANVCAVVPVRMTYEDTNGQKHILEYRVMGNGCANG